MPVLPLNVKYAELFPTASVTIPPPKPKPPKSAAFFQMVDKVQYFGIGNLFKGQAGFHCPG